jgi:hypothetical protein
LPQAYKKDEPEINFIYIHQLIAAKKATGGFRHLDEIDQLTNE